MIVLEPAPPAPRRAATRPEAGAAPDPEKTGDFEAHVAEPEREGAEGRPRRRCRHAGRRRTARPAAGGRPGHDAGHDAGHVRAPRGDCVRRGDGATGGHATRPRRCCPGPSSDPAACGGGSDGRRRCGPRSAEHREHPRPRAAPTATPADNAIGLPPAGRRAASAPPQPSGGVRAPRPDGRRPQAPFARPPPPAEAPRRRRRPPAATNTPAADAVPPLQRQRPPRRHGRKRRGRHRPAPPRPLRIIRRGVRHRPGGNGAARSGRRGRRAGASPPAAAAPHGPIGPTPPPIRRRSSARSRRRWRGPTTTASRSASTRPSSAASTST